MTLTADPIVGSTRVVLLAPDATALRGGAAEFRRFGLSIVLREDVLAALTEVVHDRTATLVVSPEIPCTQLRDLLDLAVATCSSSVVLGLTPTTDAATVSAALRAGVRGTVDLPLTPERLARTLRVIPTGGPATGPIKIGELTVDAARHRIEWAGHQIDASPREFAVVLELAQSHPRMVPLDQLAAGYQGAPADPQAAVRVVINHLRARIAKVAEQGGSAVIETVRGVGYRLAG
ncbi:winged helix-turn-helix domain-containing protein [Microbacterium sp.]|uniref:winged helix-turn-helix domain-containing protein n=1 Tax=Microbacterium sp. TaxID=51671 RepID=UPI003F6F910C